MLNSCLFSTLTGLSPLLMDPEPKEVLLWLADLSFLIKEPSEPGLSESKKAGKTRAQAHIRPTSSSMILSRY